MCRSPRLSGLAPSSVERLGYTGFLGVPLRAGERIIGALAFRARRTFTRRDCELAEAFADQAAIALEHARLRAEAEERQRHAEALARLARIFNETLDVETVYARVVREVPGLFGVRSASLRLLRADGSLERASDGGQTPEYVPAGTILPAGAGVAGRAVLEGRPVWSRDLLSDPALPLDASVRQALEASGNRAFLSTPLRVKGQIIGTLTIRDREVRDFAPTEVELLEAVADQAALALENARLHEETEQRRREAQVLADLARTINASLDVDTVLQRITEGARELTGSDLARIALRDVDSDRVRFRYWVGVRYEAYDQFIVEPGKGVSGQVMATGRPFRTDDYFNDRRISLDYAAVARVEGVVAELAVAIRIGERIEGLLNVDNRSPRPFTDRDEAILLQLADHAAIALQNARLYETVEVRATRLRTLANVTRVMSLSLDVDEVLRAIARAASELMGGAVVAFWVADEQTQTLRISAFSDDTIAADFPLTTQEFGQGASGWVAAYRQPLTIPDIRTDPRYRAREWSNAHGFTSFMALPILRQSSLLGVLTLHGNTPFRVNRDEQSLLESFATQAGATLDHARLYAEMAHRLEETRALLEVVEILNSPLDSQHRLELVTSRIAQVCRVDRCSLELTDGERLTPLMAQFADGRRELAMWAAFMESAPRPALAQARALATRRPVIIDDAEGSDQLSRESVETYRYKSYLAVPLIRRDEAIGVLTLDFMERVTPFQGWQVQLATAIAGQLALALENAELTRQREVRLRETETLLQLSRALSSTLDVDTLLRQFMQQIATVTGADTVGVWMLDATGQWLTSFAGYHVPPAWLPRVRDLKLSVVDDPFYAEAAGGRRAVFARDVRTDARVPASLVEALPHHSQLFVPILAKERMIGGFVAVWLTRARDFAASDLGLMEAIAHQAGVALDNARLFEQDRRRVEELSVLHGLSRAVTGELDQQALLEALRRQLPRVLPAEKFVVALVGTDGSLDVVLRTHEDRVDDQLLRCSRESVGLASVVLETGRPWRSDDYVGECGRQGLRVPDFADGPCWLGAPMLAADGALGLLILSRRSPVFTDAEERLAMGIADLAALALRSARLFEERTRAYGELAAAHDHLVRTEKLRALGEMASGVAHDFNNLLAAILGRSQLLLRRIEDPKLRQWLQVIERAASDGAQTVRRLQEFARIRRDQPRVPVDLNRIVHEALEITQSRWQEETVRRGVSLEIHTELVALPAVAGDPAELREAMTNLILNAIDAMPEGGVLTLRTARVDDQVEVAVSDTGLGMSESLRERIFDPFFTTKGPHGTGLGLSMTYGIVSRHAARITVESEEGRGSTFRITFPATEAVVAPSDQALILPEAPAGLRCLVVDDEEAVGAVIGDVLETLGHKAVVAASGAEAIERFQTEPFDAVFTDLAMPGVSGWQVVRAIKEHAPHVPVFVVTGFGVELSTEERQAHGVEAVFSKPLPIDDIVAALARVAKARAGGGEDAGWPTST